jgi:hypothetical protein
MMVLLQGVVIRPAFLECYSPLSWKPQYANDLHLLFRLPRAGLEGSRVHPQRAVMSCSPPD